MPTGSGPGRVVRAHSVCVGGRDLTKTSGHIILCTVCLQSETGGDKVVDKTRVLSVRLPWITFEKLEAEAKRQGKTPSTFMREYLTAWLDEGHIAQEIEEHLAEVERLAEALEEVRQRAGALFPGEPAKRLEGPPDLVVVPLPGAPPGVGVKVERQSAIEAGLWPPDNEGESEGDQRKGEKR
jgi:predicted DNA-binding protein